MTIGNVINHLSNLNPALNSKNLFETFQYSKGVFENVSVKDLRQRNIFNIYENAPLASGFRALNSFGFYRLSSEPVLTVSSDLTGKKFPLIRCNCLYRKAKNFDIEVQEFNVSPLINTSALGFDFSDLQKPIIINHHTLPFVDNHIFSRVEEDFFEDYPHFRKKLFYTKSLVGKTIFVVKQVPLILVDGGQLKVTFWCIFPSSFYLWVQFADTEIPKTEDAKIMTLFDFLRSQ